LLPSPQVTSALYRSKEPLKKRLKEQAKIAKWDEQTYYALQEAADKSHRALFRMLRQYDGVLEEPVSLILVTAADGGAAKTASDASLEVTVARFIRDGDGGVGGEGYSVGDDGFGGFSATGWQADLAKLAHAEDPENLIDPVDRKVAAALMKQATPTAFVVPDETAGKDDDATKDAMEDGSDGDNDADGSADAGAVVWWAALQPGSDVQAQYKRTTSRGARQESQKDGDWYAATVVKRHPLKNWARLVEQRKQGLVNGDGDSTAGAWREKALYDLR
jgi:hypothetical protein